MSEQYGASSYPYLETEDAGFCRCFRLSEDDFLKMVGGLKRYTEHRLNRSRARSASITAGDKTMQFNVPRLPSDTASAMEMILLPDLSEDRWAGWLLSEQVKKVKGIISALKADAELKKSAAREVEQKKAVREHKMAELRREAAAAYGWGPDSQSAQDWASAEYRRRYGGS